MKFKKNGSSLRNRVCLTSCSQAMSVQIAICIGRTTRRNTKGKGQTPGRQEGNYF